MITFRNATPNDRRAADMGGFDGYLDRIEYAELVQIFGEPHSTNGDKTLAEWDIVVDGWYANIYDYKNYGADVRTITNWHVGGGGPKGGVTALVQKIVDEYRAGHVGQLTPPSAFGRDWEIIEYSHDEPYGIVLYTNVQPGKPCISIVERSSWGFENRGDRGIEIGIQGPKKYDRLLNIFRDYDREKGSWVANPAQVNWCAWGGQDAETTKLVAEALTLAAQIAEAIDNEDFTFLPTEFRIRGGQS